MTGLALASVSDERTSGYATHEVLNQPGALEDYDAYSGDKPLVEAVRAFGADWAASACSEPARWSAGERSSIWRARPTGICRSCARTTASAIASTSSSFIPPITS